MSKLTVEQYEELVRRSGLIKEPLLKQTVGTIQREVGSRLTTEILSKRLVEMDLLTNWQNDKLLQGKHQGFFLGKYKLLRHLSSGGMSSVYLAEHTLMSRLVAIKVLPPARIEDASYLPRFQRECRAMASLDHPNIVRAHDFDVQNTLHYLVLEYIDGTDMQGIIEKEGPLDFERAADAIRQAADGLQHAHDMNFVHRDMKPANLMIDKRGIVKVLDLGVARITGSDEGPSLTLAHNEDVLGTADFLAPEQALNSHHVDSRADIYALGCTFYYFITGHVPFREPNLAKKLMAHQTQQPPPITRSRPDCPADLVEIIDKMMAKSVDDRFQTMKETSQALAGWLDRRRNPQKAVVVQPSAVQPSAPSSAAGLNMDDPLEDSASDFMMSTKSIALDSPAEIETMIGKSTTLESKSVSPAQGAPLPPDEENSQYGLAEPIRKPAVAPIVPTFGDDVDLSDDSASPAARAAEEPPADRLGPLTRPTGARLDAGGLRKGLSAERPAITTGGAAAAKPAGTPPSSASTPAPARPSSSSQKLPVPPSSARPSSESPSGIAPAYPDSGFGSTISSSSPSSANLASDPSLVAANRQLMLIVIVLLILIVPMLGVLLLYLIVPHWFITTPPGTLPTPTQATTPETTAPSPVPTVPTGPSETETSETGPSEAGTSAAGTTESETSAITPASPATRWVIYEPRGWQRRVM